MARSSLKHVASQFASGPTIMERIMAVFGEEKTVPKRAKRVKKVGVPGPVRESVKPIPLWKKDKINTEALRLFSKGLIDADELRTRRRKANRGFKLFESDLLRKADARRKHTRRSGVSESRGGES